MAEELDIQEKKLEQSTEEANKQKVINNKDTVMHARYKDVFTIHQADIVYQAICDENIFFFHCQNGMSLKITVYSPDIFACTYSLSSTFQEHFSYAIADDFRAIETDIYFEELDNEFRIVTNQLICKITKENMLVHFHDKDENLLCADAESFSAKTTILNGCDEIVVKKKTFKDEMFFGLGDKSCAQNLRGEKLSNWCSDAFAFSAKSDPLYRAIPFYYGLHNQRAYGIFVDNSYKSYFDFDADKRGETVIKTEGGSMRYYFMYGPELLDVSKKYMQITGKPELPPKWALGFHQCRWSYYPESRVRELADEFREREIPCDAIYLDIDYMDHYRCFSWEGDAFPDPTKMIKDLKKQGFKTVVMIDPGIAAEKGYEVYEDGLENNVFCRRSSGEIMEGPVWPAKCAFPDYTNPKVRKWWGKLYKELYTKNKVAGFWNDMNEPAVFKITRGTFPDNVMHHYDGHPCDHKKAHNIYGMQMSRASQEGLKNLKPHKRPFLLARASFSGGQRYAAVWTGDNVASWEHLAIAVRQCLRLSISGFSFNGTDVGGFVDDPSGELFVRWMQLAVFHPLFRVHSMGNKSDGSGEVDDEAIKKLEEENRKDQEPWSYGEPFTTHSKNAVELRYQLLAYIYHCFWENVTEGTPMMYPMSFYDAADEECHDQVQQFMFGESLLVHPVLKPGIRKQTVYLPKGKWYHLWTGYCFEGKQNVKVAAPLSSIPVFVKEGKVLPILPIMQHTGEMPVKEMTLKIYYKNGNETSRLYEDEGEGYEYTEGLYTLRNFVLDGTPESVLLLQEKKGARPDTYTTMKLEFVGLPFTPNTCLVDNEKHEFESEEVDGVVFYTTVVSNTFKEVFFS